MSLVTRMLLTSLPPTVNTSSPSPSPAPGLYGRIRGLGLTVLGIEIGSPLYCLLFCSDMRLCFWPAFLRAALRAGLLMSARTSSSTHSHSLSLTYTGFLIYEWHAIMDEADQSPPPPPPPPPSHTHCPLCSEDKCERARCVCRLTVPPVGFVDLVFIGGAVASPQLENHVAAFHSAPAVGLPRWLEADSQW